MDSPSKFMVSPDTPMLESSEAARFPILEEGSLHDVPVSEAESNGESPLVLPSQTSQRKRHLDDPEGSEEHNLHKLMPLNSRLPPLDSIPSESAPVSNCNRHLEGQEPAFLFLPSRPTKQVWAEITAATKTGFSVTGSAATGKVGPVVGLVDIGECEDSYMFRVALPGVKRDDSDFSCEVDPIGKVLIKGVTTTGEKSVYKYSQVFEMQTQNLCPPGHFSISFQLPGPVNPEQFSGNFGIDGILEGIVMKQKHSSGNIILLPVKS